MTADTRSPKLSGDQDQFTMVGVQMPLVAGKTALAAWMEISTEAVRFMSDRLQKDVQTQKALLACTNLDEIRKVQGEFFKLAQDQYAAEARKMMEIVGKAAATGQFPTTKPQKRGYDDVPV